ncbi:MAG: TRAP transporter permease [Clostridiales bacterium]|jgi:TRAP transporter 4TM/12TM fusion protein|nr:TRAP transporter permease [Clostridiales bacterium]
MEFDNENKNIAKESNSDCGAVADLPVPADKEVGSKAEEQLSEEEIKRIMSQYDKESNTRVFNGTRKSIVRWICIAFTLYVVAINSPWVMLGSQIHRASYVGFIIMLAILMFPLNRRDKKTNYIPWYDFIIGITGGGAFFYFVLNYQKIVYQLGSLTTIDIIAGIIGILVLYECCRRTVGWPLLIVVTVFLAYAYFGYLIPGRFGHNGYNIMRMVNFLFYTTEGIIGTPISVCSSFIFIFILFGSFLEKTGIGQFFIDFANSLAGKAAGGPAKVAVISSALMGTISGSSVANTVGSGSFTIPMMKRMKYRPEFAAAVEATASTGGQLMPPIMGAAAFLMAEMTGIAYSRIILAAAIPALLYFTTILLQVHFESKKLELKGMPPEEIPRMWDLLKEKGHLFLAIAAIVVFLSIGFTPSYSALLACLVAIGLSMFRADTRIKIKAFLDALENGCRNSIGVSIACAMAGCIVGVVTRTGLGLTFAGSLQQLSGGYLLPALFFCMLASIVLGMGVPTTANYVIMATVTAPIVIKLGVPVLAAHMFVFYFGIIADITPPVALAAYAGSAIARSDPLKTGLTAARLAVCAFIIPYIFATNPSILFGGTAALDVHFLTMIQVIITSLLGATIIAAGMTGCFVGKMNLIERLIAIAGGLCMIIPDLTTDLIGLAVLIYLLAAMRLRYGSINFLSGITPKRKQA